MEALRVVVADDHGIVRDAVRLALESGEECRVVAEAADGASLVRACREHRPDVAVIDVRMPMLDGVSATRKLAELEPAPRVVVLSAHADARTVKDVLAAGAVGYVLKTEVLGQLVDAVRVVSRGGVYLSPSVAGSVVELAIGGASQPVASRKSLSPREQEVLLLLVSGQSTKEIAAELGVSVKTIETQRKHLMDKLGIFSVAGLTKYAIREGLTEA